MNEKRIRMDGPIQLMERYRLIAYPADHDWEIYDCDEALEQMDPLATGPTLTEAVVQAVNRLEGWIG